MSEDKLIEKARAFAKNGELQRAKDILEALDSERARNLLNKVNSAIASEKQKALASRANAPKEKLTEKPKAKTKPKSNPLLFIITTIVICGACWFTMQGGIESSRNSASGQEIEIESAIRGNTDIDLTQVRVLHREDGYSLIMVTYNTQMSNETAMYAEYGFVFGTVGTLVQQRGWDFDDLALVVGDRNGNAVKSISVQMADVIAFVNEDISVETFMERMTIVDF